MITINSRLKIVNPTPSMEAYTEYEFEVSEIGEHMCGLRIWDKDRVVGFGEMTHREILTSCVVVTPKAQEIGGKIGHTDIVASGTGAPCSRVIDKTGRIWEEMGGGFRRYVGREEWRTKWVTSYNETLQCDIDVRTDNTKVVDVRLHGSNKFHGRAKCAPGDVFDLDRGTNVAVCHLIEHVLNRWRRELETCRAIVWDAGKAIDKTPLARATYSSLNQFGEYAIADLTRRYSALRTSMDPDKTK